VKTGDSPRIVRARVVGSHGSSAVSGPELQSLLGLRSTWARFHKR
jgi:peptidoglycan hydrolase-like amidase